MAWPQALNPVAIINDLKRKIASLRRQGLDTRVENEQLRNEIEQLRREKEQVEGERDRLQEQTEKLKKQNEKLKKQNEKLKKQLDQALRANKRQAAPFSRGQRKPNPQRPGRKAGQAYGSHHRKQIPEQVDEVIAVPPPAQCPDCGGKLIREDTQAQYQQEIVRKTLWRRFDIPICRCTVCQRRVQPRHPLQTSDALGAAAVQLGPDALALGVHLNKGLGLPHADVAAVLQHGYGLQIHRSTICRAVDRVARKGQPTWKALRQAARRSLVNGIDETGWRVDAQLRWLWAVVSESVTFCDILPGRGFKQAASILGKNYDGWLTHDGWKIYYKFLKAAHQSCNGHLIVRCRKMAEVATPTAARLPLRVKALLEQGLELRDRYKKKEISLHGLWTATGRLEAQMDRWLSRNYRDPANRRLVKHLWHERPYLFTFLYCPGLEATNNLVERMLRFLVVVRKNWGGNRTPRGARAQAVLTSILATAKQQGQNAIDLLVELLCSSDPSKILDIVPPIQLPKSDSSPAPPDLSSALALSSGTNYAHTA
jgi:transposase